MHVQDVRTLTEEIVTLLRRAQWVVDLVGRFRLQSNNWNEDCGGLSMLHERPAGSISSQVAITAEIS